MRKFLIALLLCGLMGCDAIDSIRIQLYLDAENARLNREFEKSWKKHHPGEKYE